jgi:hypothetical protein
MASRIATPLLFCLLLIGCTFFTAQAQNADTGQQGFARISLRNNSWWFRRFTIITYRPGERENSTFAFRLAPGTSRKFWLPVGTRVYNAAQSQVATVMSGLPLSDKPMLTVAASDDGRILPLVH